MLKFPMYFYKYVFVILYIIFFELFSIPLKAQEKFSDNLSFTPKYNYGFVIPEYQNFLYLVNKPVNAFSFNISKKTIGKNDWEQLYNYPQYGISIFYSSLGNDSVFGRELAVSPYFNLDIIRRKKFAFYNQIGVGLGYVSKKFDINDNYKNVVVGSHFNIHFNTKLGFRYQILPRITIHSGLSFDHFSNGNTHEPNIGMNSLTLYSGFDFLIGKKVDFTKKEIENYKRNHNLKVFYSIGGKHARALDSHFYFTSSVSCENKWSLSRVFYVGIGADLFYDSSTKSEFKITEISQFKNKYNFRSGIHLSQKVVYSKLSLEIQEGFYLLLTDKVNHYLMYNRGIIGFQISKMFSLRVAMKSHLHILDYPEIGIGIKL